MKRGSMNNTYILKTNINCNGCRSRVSPFLDAEENIISWEVDLEDSEKKITLNVVSMTLENVIELLDKAGFSATSL